MRQRHTSGLSEAERSSAREWGGVGHSPINSELVQCAVRRSIDGVRYAKNNNPTTSRSFACHDPSSAGNEVIKARGCRLLPAAAAAAAAAARQRGVRRMNARNGHINYGTKRRAWKVQGESIRRSSAGHKERDASEIYRTTM